MNQTPSHRATIFCQPPEQLLLKQEVEALGQHFTPRKVVQSVIRMAGLDTPEFQFANKRICDPFCGVGGFPLELINMNASMREQYKPDAKGKVKPSFVLHGFDKGFERDDERTIILAKANMLIYLAELLFANPTCTLEFSRLFNETFRLFKDNLGTFGYIPKDDVDKYDIILSNPPYVTSGSGIIKEEIRKTAATASEYPINALGLEGLSMEWIVKALRPGGKTFLIIPDGLLGRVQGRKLRDYLLRECYLDAIVSLPVRTFYANWEHTYILALTKKHDVEVVQTDPVFTYIVGAIGERLTSVKREEIDADDLPEMETLFRVFSGAKSASRKLVESQSARCKIQDFSKFADGHHWVVDRWWTKQEHRALDPVAPNASIGDVQTLTQQLNAALVDYDNSVSLADEGYDEWEEVLLGRTDLFELFIGDRVLVKDTEKDENLIPVYSANVNVPMGYLKSSNIKSFNVDSVLWGIDGNFEFNMIEANTPFANTDHCGVMRAKTDTILASYLLFALDDQRRRETFDRSFRASLSNMRRFKVRIPVRNGSFDTDAQAVIARRFADAQEKKIEISKCKANLDVAFKQCMTELIS